MGANMNYAIIKDEKVVNIAVATAPLSNNWVQSDVAQIGWSYINGVFIGPDEPAETSEPTTEELILAERKKMICTPAQMRLALHRLNLLTAVQSIADSDPEASIVWEYATQIIRTSPLIEALGDGFTPEEIDDIFRFAMTVQT